MEKRGTHRRASCHEKCKRNGVALLRVREPLCPQLKDRELTYVRSSKALNTMDQMVVDVFTLIEYKYNIKLNKDICFEKDKESIFEKWHNGFPSGLVCCR